MVSDSTQSSQQYRILQVNLNHCINATVQCQKFCEENKIDILLLTEPYIYNGSVKGFSFTYNVISEESPRAAIIIFNSTIKALKLSQFCDKDCSVILVQLMDKSFIFASIYMPKDEDIILSCDKISNICGSSYSRNILVASDSNAKGFLWRSPISDIRGDHLTELLFELDVIALNNSNVPTFWRANGESFIDITIASQSMANFVRNWRVADEETLSDHNYITFDLTIISSAINHTPYSDLRYNTKYANWDSFRNFILNNCNDGITYTARDRFNYLRT